MFWCGLPAFAGTPPLDNWRLSFSVRLGSHTLTVAGRTGAARLLLDGRKVAEGLRFELGLSMVDEGVPVAAVYADRGGASCYDGVELLFAAPLGRPVVTGSVDGTSCQARLKVGEANGEVVIVDPPAAEKPADATPAVRASPGGVWLFDAKHGAQGPVFIGETGPVME